MSKLFAKETELVAAFTDCLARPRWSHGKPIGDGWTAYHETAGWDVLLANDATGIQVGIEAKLSLNAKVLDQALSGLRYADRAGPDYRAVLVPEDSCQHHMASLALHLGIAVLTVGRRKEGYPERDVWHLSPAELPTEDGFYWAQQWASWLPSQRCPLPEYVPDVSGGDAAPVCLTPWKIKAIKLLILLERRGEVHRSDMKALEIRPTRWCDAYHGFLDRTAGGFVAGARTPDLKAQHPTNWAEIEADFDVWNPYAKWEDAA